MNTSEGGAPSRSKVSPAFSVLSSAWAKSSSIAGSGNTRSIAGLRAYVQSARRRYRSSIVARNEVDVSISRWTAAFGTSRTSDCIGVVTV